MSFSLFRAAVLVAATAIAGCAGQPSQSTKIPVIKADLEVAAPQAGPYAAYGVPEYGKAILVNIPSFELIAFEDGEPVLRSRVIIGKPRTPTPVMDTETSVVRFRPTWTPTPRMVREGYKPGTRPGGKGNPLGYLAIRLDPSMLIYLHGTNKPQLFERDKRALSHGCVRVEKWDEVAAFVLDSDVEEVRRRAFGRRTHDRRTDGIPVIIGYHTEFPNADGVMQTWKDIYHRGSYAKRASDPSAG